MGRFALLAVLVGCYAPTVAEGIPCGNEDACPTGQRCDPSTLRCVRMIEAIDAAGDAPADSPTDSALDAPPPIDFVDLFARADNATIGNGWLEKNPTVFSISGGEVTRIDTNPASYRDNIVYRPTSENVRDVGVSIRVRFVQSPPRFAQIFVRARTATITASDSYDGYLLYVDGTLLDQVVVGRQLGNVFVATLSGFTLTEPFNTTDRYRMTLSATGTSPVALSAKVEKLVGASFTMIGSTTVNDSDATRITEPGTVGFGGDEIAAYVYDEFRRTP